jgi:CheY-like chemotaxis protein
MTMDASGFPSQQLAILRSTCPTFAAAARQHLRAVARTGYDFVIVGTFWRRRGDRAFHPIGERQKTERSEWHPVARFLKQTRLSGERTPMMTSTVTTCVDPVHKSAGLEPPAASQKVVIVNGTSITLELLETVLEAGHYNVVFVESAEHAYSQIKRVQPNLVILCVQLEDMDAFQVLSMLKLDPETRDIPVLTYTNELEESEPEEEPAESSGTEMFAPKQAIWMN